MKACLPSNQCTVPENTKLLQEYQLCIHVMQLLEEEAEPMHIFIEGGGGVGKTCLGHALMETIMRYVI